MANKTKTSTPAALSYADFKPVCDLKKEEGLQTLIINLPGFKKEQLRVQANNNGDLKVSGERPTSTDGSRGSRFVKETKVPEGCDINDIRAKFIGGRLHVIMPKKVTPAPPPPVVQQQPASTPTASLRKEVADQKPKAEAPISDDKQTEFKSNENGKMGASASDNRFKGDHMVDNGSILQKLKGKKVVLGLGIAAVTVAAIGALVASKYGSNSIASPCLQIEELWLI